MNIGTGFFVFGLNLCKYKRLHLWWAHLWWALWWISNQDHKEIPYLHYFRHRSNIEFVEV